MPATFMEGNEAIARGALAAGCRFFAGYPITPATTIFQTMLALLPPAGGVCLQGEDEIASIGFCLGASMAGFKAMTATSGPGISLYSEQISFAIGSEIPVVIVDVQRLGPSTGSATRGADGDIQFLRWGNSGGLPVIVLAPVDVRDCFELTMRAFNLAESYRCPVFIASNKEIGMTRESVSLNALPRPAVIDRKAFSGTDRFLPFAADATRKVPGFLPIGGDIPVRQTSSTHGPDGYITTDPDEIAAVQTRLDQKLKASIRRFSYWAQYGPDTAETLIITYGISGRAAKSALARCHRAGAKSVALLVLKTLWPVPADLICNKSANANRILVVEMNLGQYVREIRRLLPDRQVEFIGQMNGRLIHPETIERAVCHG